MKFPRRGFLKLAGGAIAMPAISRIAGAQAFPSRPLRIFVGFPPGGPADILARLVSPSLSERLGQTIVIENRPGAAGNIATEAMIRSPADGHTLLVVVPGNPVADFLYSTLNFKFMRDTTPVSGLSNGPLIMEVNPAMPVRTVPDFIAYAKARPGKINFASPGLATTIHLCGELFNILTGTDMVHVPYKGNAPAITDLLAGQVQLMFADAPSTLGHLKAGTLRALAVTTAARSEALPELPTVNEFLPGFLASNWYGIAAPKNTPTEDRYQAEHRDQRGARRAQGQGAACRSGGGGADRLARRLRKVHDR